MSRGRQNSFKTDANTNYMYINRALTIVRRLYLLHQLIRSNIDDLITGNISCHLSKLLTLNTSKSPAEPSGEISPISPPQPYDSH